MNIIIENSSDEPIYQQIVTQVKGEIFSGKLIEGEALPSIRNLAKDLQISVITTKRAYEELEREGFIESVTGKGSFISGQNKELLREKRMKILEDKLQEIIKESKVLNLSFEDLVSTLKLLNEENE